MVHAASWVQIPLPPRQLDEIQLLGSLRFAQTPGRYHPLRSDLERIGEFDDGVFSTVDAGKLLALRVSEAGFDVTIDEYPGGHTINNKVSELIGYLEEVAAR